MYRIMLVKTSKFEYRCNGELFYNNRNVLSIIGIVQKCQRYIGTFCFDLDKMKLYKDSDCASKYEIIR